MLIPWFLRRVARGLDRLRYPLRAIGAGVDRVDRALGNALRWRAVLAVLLDSQAETR